MQFKNWLGKYHDLAARINWVRRARRYLGRRQSLPTHAYSAAAGSRAAGRPDIADSYVRFHGGGLQCC